MLRRVVAIGAALLAAAAPAAAAEVRVAVLDSGVATGHEVFVPGQIAGFWDFTSGARPAPGQTFQPGIAPFDRHGHGTAVTALAVGARRFGLQTPAMAPGTRFAHGIVLDANLALTGDLAAAIRWAVDTVDADVVNLSLGGYAPLVLRVTTGPVYDALEYARARNVLVVVANGNGLLNTATVPSHGPSSSYGDSPDVLAVGAAGDAAYTSSQDPELVADDDVVTATSGAPDAYRSFTGTSAAAPLVSGFAARIIEAARGAGAPMGVARLEQLVKYVARDTERPPLIEGYGVVEGSRLDLALAHARAGTLPTRPAPDVNALWVDTVQQTGRRVLNGRPPAQVGGGAGAGRTG